MMKIEALRFHFNLVEAQRRLGEPVDSMLLFNEYLATALVQTHVAPEAVLNVCPATSETSLGFITDWLVFVRRD
jgi:hypothetical protein